METRAGPSVAQKHFRKTCTNLHRILPRKLPSAVPSVKPDHVRKMLHGGRNTPRPVVQPRPSLAPQSSHGVQARSPSSRISLAAGRIIRRRPWCSHTRGARRRWGLASVGAALDEQEFAVGVADADPGVGIRTLLQGGSPPLAIRHRLRTGFEGSCEVGGVRGKGDAKRGGALPDIGVCPGVCDG